MKNLKFKPLSIFIQVPSIQILEERLRTRGADTEEKIQKRLDKASIETDKAKFFDITIMNDDLKTAQYQLAEIVNYFLHKN